MVQKTHDGIDKWFSKDFENLSGISQGTQYAILLSVLSALLTSLGLVFMKFAHN